MEKKYGCSEEHIAHYTSCRTAEPIEINGDLEKPVWKRAQQSPRFVDMVTGEPGFFDTRAAVLWDDQNLYVAFWVEEPFVQAHLTERDSLIFNENDIEVFIDGGDAYYEFEINALGTRYEVFFIWQDAYKRGGTFDVPEFDLIDQKALSFGGNDDRMADSFWHGRHPRKTRWAFLNWDFPGMQSAVRVQGTINDNSVVDKGWTVELAFPWQGMKWLANGRSLPPREGDIWRLFLGRFQKLTPSGQEVAPHPAWAWNKHGVYDTHLPECFTYIHFTNQVV
jgi:hypothetical protein